MLWIYQYYHYRCSWTGGFRTRGVAEDGPIKNLRSYASQIFTARAVWLLPRHFKAVYWTGPRESAWQKQKKKIPPRVLSGGKDIESVFSNLFHRLNPWGNFLLPA